MTRSADTILGSVGAGHVLPADPAYDSDRLRAELALRGAFGNIRAMSQRKRQPRFSQALYKKRNAVERFFSKIKQFRAIATRYGRREDTYLASVKLAAIRIWLRHNESVT